MIPHIVYIGLVSGEGRQAHNLPCFVASSMLTTKFVDIDGSIGVHATMENKHYQYYSSITVLHIQHTMHTMHTTDHAYVKECFSSDLYA